MSRRRFAQATASSLALAGLGLDRLAWAQSAKPNIIFVLADDLGYADVSCYGQRDYTTPNIDRLAIEGVRFTQGYANSPDCSATRTALITGRYQARLPVGLEEPITPLTPKNIGLPPSHPTLPSLLKKAGYSTTLIGKWHLGYLPDFSPLKSGYDHFFGIFGCCADYFNHGRDAALNGPFAYPLYEEEVPVERHGYMTNVLGDRAVQVIEGYARSKEPFLLSLHFTAPHWPWEGPGDEAESIRLRGKTLAHYDGGTQETYRQMIAAMDTQIGRVLNALEAGGLTDNTIVIFTSDNGGERFSDTWPFTGRKTELLEGGLRIPSLISWPRHIPPGRTSDQVTISMDWMPTLLAAAGTTADPEFPPDGVSLLPALTQNAALVPRKLFWRYKGGWQRALRDGDFKYLKILDSDFLFNVVADPMERANLKARNKDIYDRLVAEWHAWNATMLPEIAESSTFVFSGNNLADHIGAKPARPAPDPGLPTGQPE
ncbi:MAG TPA: sulfatase-like hydrolase/transferase [Xanthobacteraceae bacterium]|nr:sulfatase-like hydrolase/transferase [Xanthobacteraceae bacterium]